MGFESIVKNKAVEILTRVLDSVVDYVKKKYKQKRILRDTAFDLYLKNAYTRLNQVRTLATGKDVRNIIKVTGETDLYVKIGVKYKETIIDTSHVNNLLKIGDNILIVGTGGIGKSMLLRYLFLNSAYDSDYIPVFVELRKISNQTADNISIIKLIKECLAQYDVKLSEDDIELCLRSGKYLFLFDALDEVKEELARKTAEEIQKFCSKYPENKCIITSRHTDNHRLLETFKIMYSLPLSKKLAIKLSEKIWENDEKTVEFCKQLKDELFEKHRSFAENPLLLSMMFLTFMRNLDIPNHLADFYSKAYEAIYSRHDNSNKGFYRRDFKCKNLDEGQFKILFARVCFQTFFKQKYEFSEKEILDYIRYSAVFLGFDINEKDYLTDLRNAVCLIIKDGTVYKFAHRSFQTYFAAVYTSEKLTDEQQKQLFIDRVDDFLIIFENYCDLLDQIEHERFTKNALEDTLRDFYRKAESNNDPDLYILKYLYSGIDISNNYFLFRTMLQKHSSTLDFFIKYFHVPVFTNIQRFRVEEQFMNNIVQTGLFEDVGDHFISFEDVDATSTISEEDKKRFYEILIQHTNIPLLREKIVEWLKQLNRKKKNFTNDDYIDSL